MKSLLKSLTLSFLLVLACIAVPSAFVACTSAPSERVVAYTSLRTVIDGVDGSMKVAAQLRHAGHLTDAQWQKISDLHDNKFNPAYRAAVLGLQVDLKNPAPPQVVALAQELAVLVLSFTQSK